MNNVISINCNAEYYALQFSICTIVSDAAEYGLMRASFEERGFSSDCEYIIADNTKGNQFDAYQAISHFLKISRGKYIIIVHQDVRAIDNREKLLQCIDGLNKKDSNWALCGNAGAKGYHQEVVYIKYPSHTEQSIDLPQKVNSLDENFLLIKKSSNMTISPDLKGFHLYGTDLCIIANFLGYSCYVIAFMAEHLSKGNIPALKQYQHEFIEQYGKKADIGYIQTTCTQFYLSNSKKKNKLLNSPFFFFIIKQFKRYPYLIKSLGKKK